MCRYLWFIVVVYVFSAQVHAAEGFSYGMYIEDSTMRSAVMQKADKVKFNYRIWDSKSGAEYIIMNKTNFSRIINLFNGVKYGGLWYRLKKLIGGTTTVNYRSQCIFDDGATAAILHDLVDSAIDHSFSRTETEYCIIWLDEDLARHGAVISAIYKRHEHDFSFADFVE